MSDFGTPPPPPSFPTTPSLPPSGRTGPPWEGQGQTVQSWIDTVKGVLTDPATTFSQMRREGGLGAPLIFYVIGMLIGCAGTLVWRFAGMGLGMGMGSYGSLGGNAVAGIGLVGFLVVVPIVAMIGLFVFALLIHVALGLFGGQKFPYETTFRVLAYAQGAALPICILPLCGGIVASIWALIAAVIGIAQAHETSTGKAAAGVLTPVVVCCGLIAFFWAALIALLVGGAAAGFGQ